jgi:carboxyl-terminal processing protease
VRIPLAWLCVSLILPGIGAYAEIPASPPAVDGKIAQPDEVHLPGRSSPPAVDGRVTLATQLAKFTTTPRPAPGTNDGRIAYMTALMLREMHYLHLTLDANLSSRFLDRYLDTLDPRHIHFLQSDLAEFAGFRNSLGADMMKRQDTSPAFVVFDRFMQRVGEQAAYVSGLLSDGTFQFTNEERILLNRKNQPYPRDLAEARQLWSDQLRYEYLQERLNKESPEQMAMLTLDRRDPVALGTPWSDFHNDIINILTHRYSRILRNYLEWDSDRVLEIYLTSLAHVYDPHSDFFDKADLENFNIQMSLSLFGIGAVLSSEDGYCKIEDLNPSGPAFKSKKLKPKDTIVAVAQGDKEPVDVVDMPLNKVVDLIRGPKGTEVRLTIIPAVDSSKHVVVSLIRDQIKLEDQRAKARIIDLPGEKGEVHRLGVIDLPSFYGFPVPGQQTISDEPSTTGDVARLLAKLKQEKVGGVILDLRRNGGGSLEEAINLTGLFIKNGPVVQISDSYGETQVDEATDSSIAYDGPLIVLTSRFSASASEIVAGALQDYGRALLVGDVSTHGKGTVQSLNQLAPYIFRSSPNVDTNDPEAFGGLKLTTRKFYRASGSSTQLKGVNPDIVLPSVDDYLEVGEASLDDPLPWDTIKPAPTLEKLKLNRVQPYLAELTKRSAVRVAGEKDFDYVREDIAQVRKTLADKTISLNEAERLKEKDEADARQKARESEMKSRKLPDEKVYEITLKDVDLPGLPPALGTTNTTTSSLGGQPDQAFKVKSLQFTNGLTKAAAPADAKASPAAPPGSGDGSNLAQNAGPATSALDPDDDSDDEKAPLIDVPLVEAEHILNDYITLLPKEANLTAAP